MKKKGYSRKTQCVKSESANENKFDKREKDTRSLCILKNIDIDSRSLDFSAIARSARAREKANGSIREVETASYHLLGVLNDVLDMSKIESGKFVLMQEKFALHSAMKEVAMIIRQRCADKNITFVENTDGMKGIHVIGDKLRLNQVLINLLGNAVKFTPDCGKIKFLVDVIRLENDMVILKFAVTDTGIGISKEQRNRLFSAFEQAESSIAVKYGGTGLGLVISQNLVGMMGGVILVKSELGKGSEFAFCLSMKICDHKEETDESISASIPDLSGKKMLLVEDIEINRVIIQEFLRETNIHIEEAENGQIALDMFETSEIGKYDVVFMDVQMPCMNGYEATKAIRNLQRPDAKRVHIIAMTANAYQEDIQNALDAGMDAHLAKPIDIEKVLRLLTERLAE